MAPEITCLIANYDDENEHQGSTMMRNSPTASALWATAQEWIAVLPLNDDNKCYCPTSGQHDRDHDHPTTTMHTGTSTWHHWQTTQNNDNGGPKFNSKEERDNENGTTPGTHPTHAHLCIISQLTSPSKRHCLYYGTPTPCLMNTIIWHPPLATNAAPPAPSLMGNCL